jgi:tetratricopeptide (TPR) repeat protein
MCHQAKPNIVAILLCLILCGQLNQAIADIKTDNAKRAEIMRQADELYKHNKVQELVKFLDQACVTNPKLFGLRTCRALVLKEMTKSDIEKAKADCLTDLELGKQQNQGSVELAQSYWVLGLCNSKSGLWAQAIDAYSDAIKLKPTNAKFYVDRALAYHMVGNKVASENDATKADKFVIPKNFGDLFESAVDFHNMEMFNRALNLENSALKLPATPDQQRFARELRAQTLMMMKVYPVALAESNSLLANNPKDAKLLLLRAEIETRMGRDEKAIADFTSVVKLDPRNGTAYRERGQVYQKILDEDMAMSDFNSALKISSQDWRALNLRAKLYFGQGKNKDAIADFTKCQTFGPKDAASQGCVFELRGEAESNLHMYKEAISDFDRAAKCLPRLNNVDGHRSRAKAALEALNPSH